MGLGGLHMPALLLNSCKLDNIIIIIYLFQLLLLFTR